MVYIREYLRMNSKVKLLLNVYLRRHNIIDQFLPLIVKHIANNIISCTLLLKRQIILNMIDTLYKVI